MKKRYLIATLVVLSVISLAIGVRSVSLVDIFYGNNEVLDILWLSRIPRLASIIFAGFAMSISGLIMQQLARNKFVSPTTATTLDAAKLGILFALVLFPTSNSITKMLVVFVFSLISTMLFLGLLNHIKFKNAIFIPLLGLMLGGIIDSVTTFFAYQFNLIQGINTWLQGDFSMVIKGNYELLFITIPLVILAFLYAHRFTLAGMGEDFATNLGLKYNQIIVIGLVIVALLSSVVVITVGVIPFLGLIIPNIVSIYRGDNIRNSLWETALLGAIFLLACDILGRVIIFPYEISIGMMVGVIGTAVFLFLLVRRKPNEA
ncbi:ABC transporter permease [Culicoidibacter larvae]|uniref:ABC transporter permease n=1 Tax=Culicoidibacter larvae TaxID=2579976 RepID=A0A5R8QC66_9FIRM|nr:ABC transporter permease [Culicoidibacter larvae]TLG73880.1 ABC transporter permease [Culicoidibacter larvae]